jgi:hypothetical protein
MSYFALLPAAKHPKARRKLAFSFVLYDLFHPRPLLRFFLRSTHHATSYFFLSRTNVPRQNIIARKCWTEAKTELLRKTKSPNIWPLSAPATYYPKPSIIIRPNTQSLAYTQDADCKKQRCCPTTTYLKNTKIELTPKSKSAKHFCLDLPPCCLPPKDFDNQLSKYRFAQTNKKYNLEESRFYPTQKKHYASVLEHITLSIKAVAWDVRWPCVAMAFMPVLYEFSLASQSTKGMGGEQLFT